MGNWDEDEHITRERLMDLAFEGRGSYKRFKALGRGGSQVGKVSVGGKKWYVGSRALLDPDNGWRHATLGNAIAHAKELCEETDEPQIVVEIVRLVRPQKTPIVVEKVV